MSADRDKFDEAVRDLEAMGIESLAMGAELFQAFVGWKTAGFSDAQAVYLCGCALTGNPGKPPTC